MVFPSRGCLTCKSRRIKCDSVHPVCGRCQKSNRDCTWDQNEEAGLLFKSENAFAQGKPRRPWKSKEQREREEADPDMPPLTPILSTTEDEAFHFWVDNFLFRDDEIPEFAWEYNQYLLTYRNKARPDSSLHLAISAFSHAVFGRAMQVDKAIEDAERLFTQSIAQSEIHEPSEKNIDELLVTTMLLAFYENIMYVDQRHHGQEQETSSHLDVVGSRFWEHVSHHEGAAGLLKLRQQCGWTPNRPLDRAARRQLMRTCILRGIPAAPWLLDAAEFGEEGPVLGLDSIIVRVASLRARSLCLFLPKSARFSDQLHPDVVVVEARELDATLESWSRDIPEEWNFSGTQPDPNPGFAFDGLVHVYPTHGHAAIWNRYRAIHIIVNSIRRRALSIMAQCSSQSISVVEEQEICRDKIASLATELCRGIPSFFSLPAQDNAPKTIKIGDNVIQTNYEILPKLATLLAWPLTLAVSTEDVPEPQKQWLQCKLKSIATSLGDAALATVADQGEFKF